MFLAYEDRKTTSLSGEGGGGEKIRGKESVLKVNMNDASK